MSTSGSDQRPGEAEWLASYRPDEHERPSVTVDLAVFTIRDGAFSVLLVQRGEHPYRGHWALPGGFVDIHEDIEAAAWRELAEETGVEQFDGHLEQLRSYGTPGRDPRMRVISVAHVAIAPNLPDPQAGSDAAAARWWPIEDLALEGTLGSGDPHAPQLAFDHADILTDAVERVRSKLEYTSLALSFLREPFSLGDVRRIYQAVWGHAPALGHFRRKVLSTPGFVLQTHEVSSSSASDQGGRPPLLFRRGTAALLHPALLRPTGAEED